ncbi:MAG: hypothetical protein MAG795_00356 [Candidatus Woesearchaeota archaeon]|nr:hypothetical protein [Candidatus Woesearchaeota archaeon]
MKVGNIKLQWLGHASVKILADKIIYIDPFNLETDEKADLILITHGHYDHCSISDINKILKKDTIAFAPPDCTSKLARIEGLKVQILTPGKKLKIDNLSIETVPAYNISKEFHPKSNDWLGYIVTVDGKRIYHAGDTDKIPEMKNINADIALLPVGGKYTMNAEQAAKAANIIKPKLAIPMHYGSIVGSKEDAEKFKRLCDSKVNILEKQ